MTFGVGFPLAGARELALAAHAEERGIDALWARDVPLYWPRFGDAGCVRTPVGNGGYARRSAQRY